MLLGLLEQVPVLLSLGCLPVVRPGDAGAWDLQPEGIREACTEESRPGAGKGAWASSPRQGTIEKNTTTDKSQ